MHTHTVRIKRSAISGTIHSWRKKGKRAVHPPKAIHLTIKYVDLFQQLNQNWWWLSRQMVVCEIDVFAVAEWAKRVQVVCGPLMYVVKTHVCC